MLDSNFFDTLCNQQLPIDLQQICKILLVTNFFLTIIKIMVNDKTSQYVLLNIKKKYVLSRRFTIHQRHISSDSLFRWPFNLKEVLQYHFEIEALQYRYSKNDFFFVRSTFEFWHFCTEQTLNIVIKKVKNWQKSI